MDRGKTFAGLPSKSIVILARTRYSSTTSLSVEQEKPDTKVTRTTLLIGNWLNWSPQNVNELLIVLLLSVTVVTAIDMPLTSLAVPTCTRITIPVTVVGKLGLETKPTKIEPQPLNSRHKTMT